MPAPSPKKALQEQMARLLAEAGAGRLPWLDELARAAGYHRADDGVSQTELLAALPRCTRATLRAWEAQELPAKKVGTAKLYQPLKVLAWIYARYVGQGRPTKAAANELVEHQAEDMKFRAAIRGTQLQRITGKLIERTDHEREMIEMALQVRAALLALVMTLPEELAEKPTAVVRRELEAQISYLLREMSKGRVPVPAPLVAEIAAAVKRHAKAAAAAKEAAE